MLSTLILKKGTVVYLTAKGHKNFNYPTQKCQTLLKDTPAERLPWAGGGDKIAFAVAEDSIDFTQDPNKKIYVWVKRGSV